MADLGFLPAVTQILDATPTGGQCMLFSATLDRGVGTPGHAATSPTPPSTPWAPSATAGRGDGPPGLPARTRRQGAGGRRDRRPARPHAVLRPDQARRRPARQAAVPARRRQRRDPRQPQPEPARSGRWTRSRPAVRGCSSPPTSPPAACTSTTSTSSCTTTRRPTTRTTCTVRGVPRAPARPAPWCPSSSRPRPRDVARMHAAAAVSPQTTRVRPGHGAFARSPTPVTPSMSCPSRAARRRRPSRTDSGARATPAAAAPAGTVGWRHTG